MTSGSKRWIVIPLIFLGAWAGIRWLLPVLLPFLLGGLLALAAEPLVAFSGRKLGLSRGLSAALGVSMTLALLVGLLSLVGAFAVKELGTLAAAVPDLQQTAKQGIQRIGDWMVSVTEQAPEGVRSLLTKTALDLSDSGTELLEGFTGRIPGVLTGVLGKIPGSAIGLGTGLIGGYMISARLPVLRQKLRQAVPERWRQQYLPTLRRVKEAVGGWLKAQLKLMSVTWGLVTVGFLLLKVSYGPVWALLVAIVDAVPMLGTGIVLAPCALAALLQGKTLRAVGFVALWGAAVAIRALLEPRLVGRHLGLDPLLTLVALYAGYRFWGVPGMVLAPILAAAASAATDRRTMEE